MNPREIPPEAERFLARLEELPPRAWEEVTRPHRRPGLAQLLKGFWQHFRTGGERRAVRQTIGEDVLAAISERVQAHRASGAIPADFAALVATSSALGALCARQTLTPDQFTETYGAFEAWIPTATLVSDPGSNDV